jgi:hypothetical protein
MNRQALATGLAVALWAAAAAWALAADAVFPAGSRIGMIPPRGMVQSQASAGFEDAARHALIAITELSPQVYDRIAREFSIEQLRADGFSVDVHEPAAVADARGFLVAARQTVSGVATRKWALVVRSADLTAIVVALVPQGAEDIYPDAAMRAALASIVIRPKLSVEDLLAALPYRLGELAGFRLLQASPAGVAMLTDGPNDTTRPADQPNVIVLTRPSELPAAAQQENFARRALADFVDPTRFRVVRAEPIRIGGQPGFELLGTTQDRGDAVDLTMVQWLRFGSTGYVQMLGAARTSLWPEIFPRLRTIRDGIAAK